ncbi:MAG TPA: alpha/beta hydrolase [Aldersonia sp.]
MSQPHRRAVPRMPHPEPGSVRELLRLAGRHALHRPTQLRRTDALRFEQFDVIDRDLAGVVITDDGLELAVREHGPRSAPLTVVFVHGFANRMESFHLQRTRLAERWGGKVRMVFFDLRGHGRSAMPDRTTCTITQLGRDVAAVIDATAPRGRVVVIGHSMGGMAVLSAARQYEDLFASRVAGVGLMSTAAAGVARAGLAQHLRHPAIDAFRLAAVTAPRVVQSGRVVAKTVITPILHAASYRTPVSPSLSRFTSGMIDETPLATIANFLQTLEHHDESEVLPLLAGIPTVLVGGDADLIFPFDNLDRMAAALPDSELIRVHGAGHMVHLEFPDVVNDAIDRLVARTVGQRASVG